MKYLITILFITAIILYSSEFKFNDFYMRFKQESFADDKINLIKTLNKIQLTSEQVYMLINEINFSNDKIKALKMLTPLLKDKKNISKIISSFSFNSDKEKARKILSETKIKNNPSKNKTKLLKPLIFNQVGAWNKNDFNDLIKAIKKESFSSEKIKVLKEKINLNNAGFNAEQFKKIVKTLNFSSDMLKIVEILDSRILGITSKDLKEILDIFSFSSDKLKVLKALKNTIVDPENKYIILNSFTFGSDKKTASKILKNIKPRSLVYGLIKSKRIVFVIDVSGSMETRFKLNQTTAISRLGFVISEVKKVLNKQMNEKNYFTIITFNDNIEYFNKDLVKATPENIKSALNFLEKLEPKGGTNIYDSLKSAMNLKDIETIYFLTDGMPTSGAKTDIESIIENLKTLNKNKNIRINSTAFLIGKYKGDNEKKSISLMKRIAKVSNGIFRAIDD